MLDLVCRGCGVGARWVIRILGVEVEAGVIRTGGRAAARMRAKWVVKAWRCAALR